MTPPTNNKPSDDRKMPWRDETALEIAADNVYHNALETSDTTTSKNKELGLPFGKMQQIRIASDVDGTLRCNCTDTCTDANIDVVALFHILNKFKNTKLYVWSGGGAEYARKTAVRYGLAIADSRCISKIGAPQMDIAIDDIQDTAIGGINLIVREK